MLEKIAKKEESSSSSTSTHETFQEQSAEKIKGATFEAVDGYSDGMYSKVGKGSTHSLPVLVDLKRPPQSQCVLFGLYNKIPKTRHGGKSTPSSNASNINMKGDLDMEPRPRPRFSSVLSFWRIRGRWSRVVEEMLTLRHRVDTAECLVEAQQQELAAACNRAAETQSVLHDLKAQMKEFELSLQSHCQCQSMPALPQPPSPPPPNGLTL